MIKYENALRNSVAYSLIKNDIDKKMMSHAYMVVSPDGEAVKEMFKLVASAVFCKNNACLKCDECKKIEGGYNIDVSFINLLEKKITVDDINDLISDCYLAPAISDRKLYFILSANEMNSAAQNKLLKTLEEPPEGVTIFLGVKNEGAMLETIKSRVRAIYLDVFPVETVYKEIFAITGDEALSRSAAACSQGMIGVAERIATSDDYLQLYDKAFEILKKVQKSKDIAAVISDKVFEKDSFPLLLDILSILFRDMLVAKTDAALVQSKHRMNEITEIGKGFSGLALGRIIYIINEERKKLNFNVGSVSVAENLLFGILEVKYKCR